MSESKEHAAMRTQVEQVLELMRPSIQSDGGDVELVDVSEDGHISVRFHGACVGCPSSGMTLKACLLYTSPSPRD